MDINLSEPKKVDIIYRFDYKYCTNFLRKEYVMIILLNPTSLLLGLIAWILPIFNLMKYKKHENGNWVILSIISISSCAISLCFQIFYNSHLVKIADWSALMDTTDALVFVSSTLLVVTIILNVVTTLLYYKNHKSNI